MIKLSVDWKAAVQSMEETGRNQIPWAMSQAMNSSAFKVRDQIRQRMEQVMTIRRQWVVNGVMVQKKATKNDLVVVIGLEEKRSFLNPFEDGDQILPNRRKIAVPNMDEIKNPMKVESNRWALRNFDLQGPISKTQGKGPGGMGIYSITKGPYIFVFGRKKGQRDSSVLYRLVNKVKVKPILKFMETATSTFENYFQTEFNKSFEKAIATAKR